MTQKSEVSLRSLISDLLLAEPPHRELEGFLKGINTVGKAVAGEIAFLHQEGALAEVPACRASVLVVSQGFFGRLPALPSEILVLVSREPALAMAKVSRHFSPDPRPAPGIHPTAIVHSSARISSGAFIGPWCEIDEGAVVEEGAVLLSRVTLGKNSIVGEGSMLFPGVVFYGGVRIGKNVRIHSNSVLGADGFGYAQERTSSGVSHIKIHHLGSVEIGDGVEIGASTTIDRGTLGPTVIEKGCIIDNQVQIGHNCHLEEGVIVCGCSGLAGSVYVEKFAVIAGFVGIANKVRVGQGAQIAAFSAVSSRVPPGIRWGGVPAMPRREYARLQAYIGRLPELFGEKKKGEKS
jgi:UDP-3-O-[3-hydroxymyristoyl] glucosamine N-acyltransferase